jgi:hypothetical protein
MLRTKQSAPDHICVGARLLWLVRDAAGRRRHEADAHWVIAGPRGAAARLGMKRTTLQSVMKRLGIAKPA